jgi:hypothetical protein
VTPSGTTAGTTTRLPTLDGLQPTGLPLAPVPPGQPAALVIGTARGSDAIERRDSDAATSPWAVVVRREDGSFGRHGAVVTFPVAAPHGGREVEVGGVAGVAGPSQVTWPIAGGHARIRGDLPEAQLIAIARTVRVRDGHPVSDPPRGFRVVVTEPYEPTAIRELRFGDLAGAAFGLTYTAVLAAAGFEDQLYAGAGISAGSVHGYPAMASEIGGGNGSVAWEPAPGVVAFVGYSGTVPFGPEAIARLRALAEDARYLSGEQWRDLQPFADEQDNAFGFDDFG